MDNLDDSENNAKISDSAYSNSCSNSQSRRSRSSKSTHSGSHSSGSSGYGGKPSTGSSNTLSQPQNKEKESKKKKQTQVETLKADADANLQCITSDPVPAIAAPMVIENDVVLASSQVHAQAENKPEGMGVTITNCIISKDEVRYENSVTAIDRFSCIISMQDGVVMYTTPSLTTTLGFPKDMWIGKSFIDFLHPLDRNTFASQITSGLAIPKVVNGTQNKVALPASTGSSMVCRIRRFKGLSSGFNVKDRVIIFMPFLLKFTFKNVKNDGGEVTYLVLQASACFSAFKVPNEVVTRALPFVIRHAANGNLEYIDPESVPYLGYLPQDVTDKDALQLYHPEDLGYLRQVYETIVKEGGFQRSNPYRLVTQNGHFIVVETEWTSFINPWSKKLEFVTAKHHIIEGPANPDVFQTPDPDKTTKMSEVDKRKAQLLRETIIRVMKELLTKPAELAKQQMSKRCQDLTTFMESLLEEQPKTDDELRIEIQDADHSYYERDSVMLGGISPHHEYNDSKSSTETPLSYNQLNYNENLQRYFSSHQPFSTEDSTNISVADNMLNIRDRKPIPSNGLLSKDYNSGASSELTSSCDSSALVGANNPPRHMGNYEPVKLTDSLLTKHNVEMEKKLMKTHRENRCTTRIEREKDKNETRQKKKEHLARCNATFQPTLAGATITHLQPHGVKRSSKEFDDSAHKHHCTSPRQLRRQQNPAPAQSAPNVPTTLDQWPSNPMNNMNAFFLGVGIPQQMPIMGTLPTMPGVFPMYYTPATVAVPTTCAVNTVNTSNASTSYQAPMQCMMYGQPIYGSPFLYSAMAPQASHIAQQQLMAQNLQMTNTLNPLCLTKSNYEAACKADSYVPPPEKKRVEKKSPKTHQEKPAVIHNSKALNRESTTGGNDSGGRKSTVLSSNSTEPVPGTSRGVNKIDKPVNCDETVDGTDEESSYSSFYSSFFKTESGSAEDSNDTKKTNNKDKTKNKVSFEERNEPRPVKQIIKRKMDPPWLEQVCVTSELIYKYQVVTRSVEEVLKSDKLRMSTLQQPSLVNEQLNQLYLDLQLEGVAARLTLEEGITSSGSSGEETPSTSKVARKKRDYNKYVIIHEENAPLPPPDHDMSSPSVS